MRKREAAAWVGTLLWAAAASAHHGGASPVTASASVVAPVRGSYLSTQVDVSRLHGSLSRDVLSLVLSTEWVVSGPLWLGARVPVHHVMPTVGVPRTGAGDLGLTARLSLLDPHRPWGATLMALAEAPTGVAAAGLGQGRFRGTALAQVAARLGPWTPQLALGWSSALGDARPLPWAADVRGDHELRLEGGVGRRLAGRWSAGVLFAVQAGWTGSQRTHAVLALPQVGVRVSPELRLVASATFPFTGAAQLAWQGTVASIWEPTFSSPKPME